MIGGTGLGLLGGPATWAPRLPAGYETYRRMRRDPTIALARALAIAPVVAGKWTVEADADVPQEVRGWIDKQFLTVREPLLETILTHGYVDFGHQGFELVWGLDAEGRQCIVRFKPLLPDITEILIDDHGGLAGLRQRDVVLTGVNAMLVSFGGEGSDLHGEPLLENVREVWNDWRKANEVAARYDRKIAGAYLLLHYPSFGQGIDQNGAKLDNVYMAQRILDKLEAASGVAIGDVPSELAPGQDPNQTAWRLEVQGSAGGQQQGFVDRLRYLDSLKVRGMLLPERAILEGQHGTLAESQSQGDLAFLQAELVHHHVTREINRQAVDPVLEANWGPAYRGKVRLEAAPLSSDNQAFLRQLVTQVLSDPKDFVDLFRRADWSSIFDAVGLPQTKASSAAPSSPATILSTVGQLRREPFEEPEETTGLPSGQEWPSLAGSPSKDVAVESEDVHNEDEVADAILMHNFHRDQPRDTDGKWKKVGSNATSSAAKSADRTLAEAPPPKDLPAHPGQWEVKGIGTVKMAKTTTVSGGLTILSKAPDGSQVGLTESAANPGTVFVPDGYKAGTPALRYGVDMKIGFSASEENAENKGRWYFVQYAQLEEEAGGKSSVAAPWFVDGRSKTPDPNHPNAYNPQSIGDFSADATDGPADTFRFHRDDFTFAREPGGWRLTPKQGINLEKMIPAAPNYPVGTSRTWKFQTYLVDGKTKKALGHAAWSFRVDRKPGGPEVTNVEPPAWKAGADPGVWKPIQ